MITIVKKEVALFFSSWIGLIALTVLFVAFALIVFVFPETNVLDYGYASLESFFNAAPYILFIFIPAITMRSFAEEKSSQTIELLRTKPLSLVQIIAAKFTASKLILFFALLPTLCYVFIISKLAEPVNNIDYGGLFGSFLGLFLLGVCYVAIGIFASSLTNNQIVAFIVAVFLCFAMYFAFTSISNVPWLLGKGDYVIQQFGLQSHYESISRGVVSLADVVYFATVASLFLLFTFAYLTYQEL